MTVYDITLGLYLAKFDSNKLGGLTFSACGKTLHKVALPRKLNSNKLAGIILR